MIKIKVLLFSFFCIASITGWAQKITIKGTVTDGKDALVGAYVVVKGSEKTNLIVTTTDIDGAFAIQANPDDVLVVSFIGYNKKEVPIGGGNFIPITLQSDAKELEQVVVVGYGVQTKASSVGSITTTKGEDLLKVGSVTSVSAALQGQMAGVVAINSTSKPGADAADLFIRGKSTWGDASPLVLIDGIERDFNDVDINEIGSISVLKDASATAVYGVKGANGVILITTKRGSNEKPQVSLTANFGFKLPSTSPEYADYATAQRMFNEGKINDQDWGGLIPESTINAWDNALAIGNYGSYNDIFPQVNWWDELIRKVGYQQNYNINVEGGTEKMRYFTSIGYLNDGDIYKSFSNDKFDPSFNYKRFNWRSNFDFNLTKTTLLSLNIAGKMGYRNQPAYRPGSEDSWFFKFFYDNSNNEFPIKYSDGEWGSGKTGEGNLAEFLSATGSRKYKTYQGFYDLKIEQKLDFITKGLSAKASLSYTTSSEWDSNIMTGMIYGADDLSSINSIIRYNRSYDYTSPIVLADGSITYPLLDNTRFQNETNVGNYPVGGSYDNFTDYNRKLYYELAINYVRTYGNHKITALALVNRKKEEYTINSNNLDYPVLEEAWVGRTTYSYKDKYLFEINGAYTGSEKFAPGKRFGFFSSYSAGWRISEENWFKNLAGKNISNLKLKYSYGTVGNDKGAPRFNYIQSFNNIGGNAQFGLYQNFNWGPLYSEGRLADPDATWEKSIKQNLGLEVGVKNKLNISIDLFSEDRNHILMARNTIPASLSSAVSLPSVNIGKTKNHGLEVEAKWNDKVGKINYYIKVNFATSENRIVFKDDPRSMPDYMKSAGKSIGVQSKYLATGNFESIDDIFNSPQSNISNGLQNTLVPGDLYYIDYNGDGIISSNDQVPISMLNYPQTTAGLALGGEWNGFGLNALFYTAIDVYKEQISSFLWDFPTGNIKAQPNTLDRWTPDSEHQDGAVQPAEHINNSYNSLPSTYTYTNHEYIRLKNLELNYQFPKTWIHGFGISRCQFYFSGDNLFTFSNADSRRDPETSGNSVYPIIKRYNLGFRLGF